MPEELSLSHGSILKTGALLGYSLNVEGCCCGFTLKWLSACLIGEENRFNQRINTILHDEHLVTNINRIKDKVRLGEESQADKDYLEILEFYEGMLLFQSPASYSELYGETLSQLDFELTSPFASSDKIFDLGGLVLVHSDCGMYTKEGVENYLNQLEQMIDSIHYDSVDPMGFYLGSTGHAIGLTYNKTNYQWSLKNTNDESSFLDQTIYTRQEIAEKIFQSMKLFPSEEYIESIMNGINDVDIRTFNDHTIIIVHQTDPEKWVINGQPQDSKEAARREIYRRCHGQAPSPYATFSTSIITTVSNEQKFQLKTHFESFKQSFIVTDDITRMEEVNNLVIVASNIKNTAMIKSLIQHGLDVNKTITTDRVKTTIAILAAQHGLLDVLQTLEEYHVDFNIGPKNITLLMAASIKAKHTIIDWLLTRAINKPNIDAQMDDGLTALHLAAQYGIYQVISLLVEHGAQVDKLTSKGGWTPIHIAASLGHLNVVQELIKCNANPNICDSAGATPLFIAAQLGNTRIVKFLLSNSQSQSIPFISSVTSLQTFASSKGESVIQRMQEMIEFKLSSGDDLDRISIFPQEIAWIMGHQDTIVAFPVTLEDEIRRAPIRTIIIDTILKSPDKNEWRCELLDNLNPVDRALMQLEINQQGLRVDYHACYGHDLAHFSISRPETSKRLSVGSTDPRWQEVNTSLSQLFTSETETIRNQVLKQLRANPANENWRLNLRNDHDSPFNQDALDVIKFELEAEGFVIELKYAKLFSFFGATTTLSYFSIIRPTIIDMEKSSIYASELIPIERGNCNIM